VVVLYKPMRMRASSKAEEEDGLGRGESSSAEGSDEEDGLVSFMVA
jgi:hypothetical protein